MTIVLVSHCFGVISYVPMDSQNTLNLNVTKMLLPTRQEGGELQIWAYHLTRSRYREN